jgi:hypothetical protein
MKRHVAWSIVALVLAACDPETEVAATTTTTSSSAGGGGGTGGGGNGGMGGEVCPSEPSDPGNPQTCSDVDHVCQYGSVCCICSNITCAIVWECVDPSMNDAACPAGAPARGTACQGSLGCSYCVGGAPELWVCSQDQWTESGIVGCI